MTRSAGGTPPGPSAQRWPPGTLLHMLDPEARDALLALGTRRAFAPGEALITEGGPEKEVFLLLSGCVKVVRHPAEGRTLLLSIRVRGDVVGEMAALENDEPRSATVVAATRVRAQVVGQRPFLALLDARPAMERVVSRAVVAKVRLITRHRVDVTGAPVLFRLARMLEYLLESHATPCPEGLRIDVPLSQSELAGLIGASAPSLHRALRYLRGRGVLSTQYRQQTVSDRALLEKIAREADPDANRVARGRQQDD